MSSFGEPTSMRQIFRPSKAKTFLIDNKMLSVSLHKNRQSFFGVCVFHQQKQACSDRRLISKNVNVFHTPAFVLQLAIRNDEELNKLLGGVTSASGGVLPNIQQVLLKKKSK